MPLAALSVLSTGFHNIVVTETPVLLDEEAAELLATELEDEEEAVTELLDELLVAAEEEAL